MGNLKRAKYKDLELEFQVVELQAAVVQAVPLSIEQEKTVASHSSTELAQYAPVTTVIEAWNQLEASMIACITRKGLSEAGRSMRGHSRLGHVLLNAGLIDKDQFDLFHRMRELRNRAVHAEALDVGPVLASSYAQSAKRLAVHMDAL